MSTKQKFTLIEMMVVLSIIAILMSFLLPSLGKGRKSAKRAVCISNMRQLGIAVSTYTVDNDRYLPGGIYLSAKPRYKTSDDKKIPYFLWPYTELS